MAGDEAARSRPATAESPRSDDGGPRAAHEARRAELAAIEAALAAKGDRISSLRGVTFLIAAGVALGTWLASLPRPLFAVAAIAACAFVFLVVRHAVLVTRAAEVAARRAVVERALARIDHAWAKCGPAAPAIAAEARGGAPRFEPAKHPYAVDLDVLGEASLYRLVNTARTADGEQRVAAWLLDPAPLEVARARQLAAREIAGARRFREDLEHLAAGAGTGGKERDPILGWADAAPTGTPLHALPLARAARAVTLLAIAGLAYAAVAPTGAPLWAQRAWILPALLQIGLLGALREPIAAALSIVGARDAPFAAYLALVRRIEAERFDAPALAAPRAALDGATAALGRLARAVSFAEARENALARLLLNGLFAWDLHAAVVVERWRTANGARVAGWVSAIAEIEALASLGALAHDHPDFTFAELVDGAPRLDATALGHPLIVDDRRVSNDVALGGDGPRALLVTGSNMSGKSTLLRAIGVNAALALAGAPCCCERLVIAPLRVWTSMRVTDSLEGGVSHFYAELARLKAVVDAKDRGDPVLFLLDEVMHGTNSRERQIGARAVTLDLVRGDHPAIGAVSSHDLGLGDLEQESGGVVRAVHFEEQVDAGKMTFDYRMKPGVVRSGNALRLMRELGLPV
ncbi:MAG TPA: DNA mismatch repair protein MutS [Byssovorax sp.]